MAIASSIIGAIGLAVSAAGVATQVYGATQAASASNRLAQQQRQAEQVRQQQMTLEAMRRKREIIRNAQVAQSQATAAANSQGGLESSGFQSALSTISNRADTATLATNQNQELGNRMFDINQASAGLMAQRASAEGIAATGSGLSSLGGSLIRNQQQIANIGTYFSSRPA